MYLLVSMSGLFCSNKQPASRAKSLAMHMLLQFLFSSHESIFVPSTWYLGISDYYNKNNFILRFMIIILCCPCIK